MNIDLDAVLRDRLDRRRGDWPRIAKAADISHSWLSQFARRKIPNPGLETLRRLAAALNELDAPPPAHAPATAPGALEEAKAA